MGFQNKRLCRWVINGEPAIGLAVLGRLQFAAVHRNAKQLQLNAPQRQRPRRSLGKQLHPRLHQHKCVLHIHVQLDGGELESPGGVIGQTDRGSSSHAGSKRQLTRS